MHPVRTPLRSHFKSGAISRGSTNFQIKNRTRSNVTLCYLFHTDILKYLKSIFAQIKCSLDRQIYCETATENAYVASLFRTGRKIGPGGSPRAA